MSSSDARFGGGCLVLLQSFLQLSPFGASGLELALVADRFGAGEFEELAVVARLLARDLDQTAVAAPPHGRGRDLR